MNKKPETGMQLICPPKSYTAFFFSSSKHFRKDQTHRRISAEPVVSQNCLLPCR